MDRGVPENMVANMVEWRSRRHKDYPKAQIDGIFVELLANMYDNHHRSHKDYPK